MSPRAASAPRVRLKRVYEPASPEDGVRVLVDRLWPRGLRKADAAIDQWLKDIAPSAELRKWFGHDPARWLEFRERYGRELAQHATAVERLRAEAQQHTVTLLFSAHDEVHNNAVALRDVLLQV
jgi:uncharacterized protein YeaO (DUF488 family)